MSVWDAHAHFFSTRFYAALASQVAQRRGVEYGAVELAAECEVEVPPSDESLAERWRSEFDAAGLDGAVLIASIPGDQDAVLAAAEESDGRVLPYAMFHPAADGAAEQLANAAVRGLRGVCLFPAMHQLDLHSEPVSDFVGVAAEHGPRHREPRELVKARDGRRRVGWPSADSELGSAQRMRIRTGRWAYRLPTSRRGAL